MSKVAVVIPLFNKVRTVGRTIASVREQTFHDIEIVVVDDGSTDDPKSTVLEAFGDDERCTYVYQDNAGVAHARNNGVFKHTTAPYVMCLDSDDAIEKRYIANLLAELEKDQSLGIAYTSLRFIKPDGATGVSPWPDEFNADEQMAGKNQVPTSALTTRVMWDRLGGQRQRYAPLGAGAEDGDFWTRAVSYGFGAKYVHPGRHGFFIYSWLSGIVTGDPTYRQVDHYAWSPWARDYTLMPTPSLATPKMPTHAARQYDEPSVSVIIPVGPGHAKHLVNCLDSLDSQTYKPWEAIVVFDISKQEYKELGDDGFIDYIAKTWPFCRFANTTEGPVDYRQDMLDVIESKLAGQQASVLAGMQIDGNVGTGTARNIGIKMARAPLLLFLDADDWLTPTAIKKMVQLYLKTGHIIYTDHMAIANIPMPDPGSIDGILMAYSERRQEAYIHQALGEYNCKKAMEQPYTDGRPPYIICNVSSLVPRKWVDEVGGFNTDINSWEDVLLFWMLAWRGKCFTRIPEPLLVYRYGTGGRELGRKNAKVLLEYLSGLAEKEKQEGRVMGRCGCKGGGKAPPIYETSQFSGGDADMVDLNLSRGGRLRVVDTDVVLAEFNPPDKGGMMRYGLHQFEGGLIKYGHFGGGETFYVHVKDVEADKAVAASQGRAPMFVVIKETTLAVIEDPEEVVILAPPSEIAEAALDTNRMLDNEPNEPDYIEELLKIDPDPVSPEDVFPKRDDSSWLLPDPLLVDLDIKDLKSPHRYLAKLAAVGIITASDVVVYNLENDEGIGGIKGIGPKAEEAILNAVKAH